MLIQEYFTLLHQYQYEINTSILIVLLRAEINQNKLAYICNSTFFQSNSLLFCLD